MEVIREKGRLIEKIGQIEEEMAEAKVEWPEIEGQISSEERTVIYDLVEELRGLIRSVIDQDNESNSLLLEWAQELGDQASQVRQSREAAKAYQAQRIPGGSTDPLVFDKKE